VPRNGVVIWLMASQLIGLLSLLPWLVFAAQAYTVVTSGITSGLGPYYAILAYPLLPVGLALLAWILFAARKDIGALVSSSLPLLVALPMVLYYVYIVYFTAA
jgi:hypothetical protein